MSAPAKTTAPPEPHVPLRPWANQAYPEHEKIRAAKGHDEIGQFLDWLMHTRRIELCEYVDGRDFPVPARFRGGIEGILAEYFEVDLDRLDDEKRAMLKRIREEL